MKNKKIIRSGSYVVAVILYFFIVNKSRRELMLRGNAELQ